MTTNYQQNPLISQFGAHYSRLSGREKSRVRHDFDGFQINTRQPDAWNAANEYATRIGGIDHLPAYAACLVRGESFRFVNGWGIRRVGQFATVAT